MRKDNNPIKGLTVAQFIEQLKQLDQSRIVMVETTHLAPFMLKHREATFHKHPELNDTIVRLDIDSPDYDYMLSRYIPVHAIVLSQDK